MNAQSGMGSEPRFLQQLVNELIAVHGKDAKDLVIILPGKRARIFLQREWAMQAGAPVWAPEVLTMEEFVGTITGLTFADELQLVLNLFKICRHTEDYPLTFERFSGWASVVLRDFNDVDLFMADPSQVFINLLEARELTLWSPGSPGELSDFEQQYVAFYRQLLPWYHQFRKTLSSKGMAYQGMAFRQLAEEVHCVSERMPGRRFVFAGFNAFTPSEQRIVTAMQQQGIADIIWDADSWYLDDELREAGHFIRDWRNSHPSRDFRYVENHLATAPKSINVYGVGGVRGQTRLAGELLGKVTDASPAIAVVLPDESLLLPMLNAVPDNIEKFNVTMGLPIQQTPALSWLQLNLLLFGKPAGSGIAWVRMVHLLPVTRHPWFNLLWEGEGVTHPVQDPISKLSRRFVDVREVIGLYKEAYPALAGLAETFFSPVQSPGDFITKMEASVRHLLSNPRVPGQPFVQGALVETLRILRWLDGALKDLPENEDGFAMLRFLLNRVVQKASIPFTGEPLEGIQILGLLETRNLDFDHVILLSANEGTLPAGKKHNSLIPADIRTYHGLPGWQYHDAIYAYHFFHLIQRAGKVDIIYNTDLSSGFAGEMSRFIRQIETGMLPDNPSISYQHYTVSDETVKVEPFPAISIPKSDGVYDTLVWELTHAGISPSHISRYISCPLMFYFSFVARIAEPELLEETVDFRELGTLVHNALMKIYAHDSPKEQAASNANPGKALDEDFIKLALKDCDTLVAEEMKQWLGGNTAVTGKNLIILGVAQFMVKRFLENEREQLSLYKMEVLLVEQRLSAILPVKSGDELLQVAFKGFVDRIDRVTPLGEKGLPEGLYRNGSLIRISDYKTGKVEMKDLKFETVEEVFSDPKLGKALQLLFYCWVYAKNEYNYGITSGIFPLKTPSVTFLELPAFKDKPPGEVEGILQQFESGLIRICEKLLDRSIPFTQTDDPDTCKNCPYHPVCMTTGM